MSAPGRLARGLPPPWAARNGQVTAHAWLVADGVNLDPTGSARFTAVVPTTRGTLAA